MRPFFTRKEIFYLPKKLGQALNNQAAQCQLRKG